MPATSETVNTWMSEREEELIELHRALVRLPTINWGEGRSAREHLFCAFAADWLAQRGIASRTVEHAAERGNLLAEIGTGERRILLMSHSDVVPAGDEAAWTHPPFSGELADGRIWGRGAKDCKMLVAAQMFALAALIDLGLTTGRVALAVGADEEVGGAEGFGFLAREHADFLKADFAICEGGGGSLGAIDAGRTVIGIGTGEKGRCEVTYRITAPGGHASTPWGKRNPLSIAAELIRRIEALEHAGSAEAPILPHVARWFGIEGGIDAANLEQAIARIEALHPGLGPSLRGWSRMSFTPTKLEAGEKSNAIASRATLVCDARMLPTQTPAMLERLAREVMNGLPGVELTIDATANPSISKFDARMEGLFLNASRRALGGRELSVAPVWCIGFTDAHFVREVGTPVYGYQLIHPDADPERLGIHCVDESIEARMLLPCAASLGCLAAEYFASA